MGRRTGASIRTTLKNGNQIHKKLQIDFFPSFSNRSFFKAAHLITKSELLNKKGSIEVLFVCNTTVLCFLYLFIEFHLTLLYGSLQSFSKSNQGIISSIFIGIQYLVYRAIAMQLFVSLCDLRRAKLCSSRWYIASMSKKLPVRYLFSSQWKFSLQLLFNWLNML